MDAGKLKPNIQSINFSRLVQDALDEIAVFAQKKGVQLATLSLPSELIISADPGQIKRAIVKLFENAVKYTPSDGHVEASCRKEKGWVELTITDTGIGIPREDCDRVFEKFYRTDQADALQERGTGIGLAIVKGIVNDGEIKLESTVGVGSIFTIRLPVEGPAA